MSTVYCLLNWIVLNDPKQIGGLYTCFHYCAWLQTEFVSWILSHHHIKYLNNLNNREMNINLSQSCLAIVIIVFIRINFIMWCVEMNDWCLRISGINVILLFYLIKLFNWYYFIVILDMFLSWHCEWLKFINYITKY